MYRWLTFPPAFRYTFSISLYFFNLFFTVNRSIQQEIYKFIILVLSWLFTIQLLSESFPLFRRKPFDKV